MLQVADLLPFLGPILLLVLGSLATLVAEPLLSRVDKHRVLPWIGIVSTGLAAVALAFTKSGHLWGILAIEPTRAGLVLVLLAVLALGLAALQRNLSSDDFPGGEPYVLMQLAAVGILLMVLASQTIALFLGMELASLSIYPLVGCRRDQPESAEAVLKYFAQGAVFSAIFLYGAALSYGATGTVFLAANVLPGRETVQLLGFLLMAVGLLFKIGAAPFHFWSPDAYAGAPSGVTAFMSGAVKIGAVAALGNLWIGHLVSLSAFPSYMVGTAAGAHFPPISLGLQVFSRILQTIFQVRRGLTVAGFIGYSLAIFGATAVLSIAIGSLSLLGQTSVRRLIAYSGVANAGFLVVGFLLPGIFIANILLTPTLYYLAAYALAAAGTMAGIAALTGPGDGGDHISSLTGAARKRPLIGLSITVLLASLAGLPPTAGFVAKFQILSQLFLNASLDPAILQRILPSALQHLSQGWLLAVPIGAFAFAIVAAAGYFKLAVALWTDPVPNSREPEPVPVLLGWAVPLAALAVVALAIFPRALFGG